ncbi:MAG: hypothetical protein CMF59_11335 [Leptospiraceae bacterium]|nr:hypothetical protein [Leptospiraceae bacterium]
MPHRVASGDHFAPEEYTTINADRLALIKVGETTEEELLQIFDGKYDRHWTMDPEMPLPRNPDIKLYRTYRFQDVALYSRDISGGGHRIVMHGWHHRIFLSVYMGKDSVLGYSVSHDVATENNKVEEGPLDGMKEGFIRHLSKEERKCMSSYYSLVIFHDESERKYGVEKCWWFADFETGRL